MKMELVKKKCKNCGVEMLCSKRKLYCDRCVGFKRMGGIYPTKIDLIMTLILFGIVFFTVIIFFWVIFKAILGGWN